MAERVNRPSPPPAGGAAGEQTEKDLDVLHPEREVQIGGHVLVVREYGFVEGLKVLAKAAPVLKLLRSYAERGRGTGTFAQVEQLFVEHTDLMIDLVAQAADVEPQFVRELGDEDGFRLMQVWWLANQGFFLRRVVQAVALARAEERRAGHASTPPSSVQDSDAAPPTSAA